MSKVLVSYFSATGRTRKVAEKLANQMSTNLYEIKPAVPYTIMDLNWLNPFSRSSKEMKKKIRPELASHSDNIENYDIIYVGFPIWWYVAPTIINAFLEDYNLTGKKIILYATSGSSGFGRTREELLDSAPGAEIIEGKVLRNDKDIQEFIEEFA